MAALAAICVLGGTGVASMSPRDDHSHRSSLKARVTMADGTTRAITLEGVGCTASMCSRVAVRSMKTDSIWLDGLASMRNISDGTEGVVTATFTFKDGSGREASVVPGNRILYIEGRFGRTQKLDLGSLTRIDFE